VTAPRTFPALDIRWPPGSDPDDAFGRLLAAIDDARPTSAEETADGARVFFASAGDRDRAAAIIPAGLTYVAVAVPDEGWAERSQASLSATGRSATRLVKLHSSACVSSRKSNCMTSHPTFSCRPNL